jgi:competence protein ComEC
MQWWMIRRRVHTSWLIALASVAFLVGAVAVQYIDRTFFASAAWVLLGTALLSLGLWGRQLYLIPLIVIGGVVLGLWRGSVEQAQLVVYKKLYNSAVVTSGNVSEDADIGANGELVLRLDQLQINGHLVAGKMWVSAATKFDIKRGDIVTASGKMGEGFGNFSATMYRAKVTHVQRPVPGDVARQVRDWFADAIRLGISEPQASLGIGYLVGQRRALPEDLSKALQIAGLTHVVVASGYNLTILVRLARRLFAKVSKYVSTLAAATMILAFVAITGASPSMTRAGLVAGLSLAAWYYGRAFHPLVLLPFAAMITVMINPSYVWGDLGWQLSFAAFAGVMIVGPLLQAYFFGPKEPGTIRQILGETISAQLVTLPILVLAFGQFSNVAVIANLLVLSFVPLAMLLTFIAGVAVLIVPNCAVIIGLPAQWLLTYMTTVTEYLAGLPWAQAEVQVQPWHVAMAYILLSLACAYMWRATRLQLQNTNVIE